MAYPSRSICRSLGGSYRTIFEYLREKYPGKFKEVQLRTLQKKVKKWRALEGLSREAYFPQIHEPGILCQSDFTSMNDLAITILGERFDHLLYHFVLTYSNWETGSICYSESFASLSSGLQNALFVLGAVPEFHQSDNLSAAVNNLNSPKEFTLSYQGLLKHFGMQPKAINARKANENGDIEQRHYRFKSALSQALMMRGSTNFNSLGDYEKYLQNLFKKLNLTRKDKLAEEIKVMKKLHLYRLDTAKRIKVRVSPSSTITVQHNIYSVHSRMIGEWVEARVYADEIEVWYSNNFIDKFPRLRGSGKHKINYRHIIDSLVRKPGALKNYRFKSDLFPTSRFRMAYDLLSAKQYLEILYLAAKESETLVDDALRVIFASEEQITPEKIRERILTPVAPVTDVYVQEVSLKEYDALLEANYG